MNQIVSAKSEKEPKTISRISTDRVRSCVLHVCTSCRAVGSSREPIENRAGFKLYQALRAIFNESPVDSSASHQVEVKPTECLSLCPRPCAIALSSAGAWSYLFGDQQIDKSVSEIVECVSQYMNAPDGFMPRKARPKHLKASILGRVPPLEIAGADVPFEPSQASGRKDKKLAINA